MTAARDLAATAGTGWWRPSVPRSEGPALPAGGSLPFSALMVFTFVLLAAPQFWFPALGSLRIALLAGAAAAGSYLLERLSLKRPLAAPDRLMLTTACLVAWAVATLPLSLWPAGSLAFLLDTWLKTLIVFWLLSRVVDTIGRLKRTAWVLVGTAVMVAASAVSHYVSGAFVDNGMLPELRRIAGYEAPLTGNPNDLALTINLILPFAFGLFLIERDAMRRALLLGLTLLFAAAVVLTFSRGGFLTLMTIALIYVWRLARRSGPVWLLVALLPAAGLALLPSGYLAQMGTIAHIDADPTGSARERFDDMVAAAGFVLEHPVAGAGAGMNVLAMNEARGEAWRVVHNVYLQYAVELGIPGLALFLCLMMGCLRRARDARRRAASPAASRELFHMAEAVEVSLLAFAVAACFHPVAYHFYFYYPAGLALALKRIGAQEAPA